jgi:hypothetical protein
MGSKRSFPGYHKAAWASKKGDISKATPGATSRKFIYTMHRKDYHRDFVSKDERPPSFANVWSLLFRIAPKIGPLRVLKFKAPEQLQKNYLSKVLIQRLNIIPGIFQTSKRSHCIKQYKF